MTTTDTPAPSAGRAPSAFFAIVRYGWRACLPARRRWSLLLPCLGALLLGLLAHALDGTPEHAFAQVADGGLFSVVFPIGCLIVGDAMVGAEVRAGTLSFTWLSPVRLPVIVVGRWLTGTLIAAVVIGGSCALAAVVAGAPDSAPPMLLATAAGAAAYVALFVLIGCTTRRAAVWSLAVVFLVERLLGAALAGIAQLSPTWETRAVFAGLAPDAESLYRSGIPDGWSAVIRLGMIAVVCLALASWRLGRLRLSGATD